MGARAITILIGSVLGAKHNVLAPNSAICWKTLKHFVLSYSENQNDVTMGNQQERKIKMKKIEMQYKFNVHF